MSDLSKRRQRQLKNEGYDLAFLSQIQPQGNIDFKKDDRSWLSGDGYHTVLHYYEYPTEGMDRFWLSELLLLPGTRAFLSLYKDDNSQLQKEIEDSIEDHATRIAIISNLRYNR